MTELWRVSISKAVEVAVKVVALERPVERQDFKRKESEKYVEGLA